MEMLINGAWNPGAIGIRQSPERFFASITEEYLRHFSIQPVKIGNAESYLLEVKSFVDFAVTLLVKAAEKYPC